MNFRDIGGVEFGRAPGRVLTLYLALRRFAGVHFWRVSFGWMLTLGWFAIGYEYALKGGPQVERKT